MRWCQVFSPTFALFIILFHSRPAKSVISSFAYCLLWYLLYPGQWHVLPWPSGRQIQVFMWIQLYLQVICFLKASWLLLTTPAQAGPGGGADWPPEVSGQLLQRHEDGAAPPPEADLGLRLPFLSQHDRQQGGRRQASGGAPHLPM